MSNRKKLKDDFPVVVAPQQRPIISPTAPPAKTGTGQVLASQKTALTQAQISAYRSLLKDVGAGMRAFTHQSASPADNLTDSPINKAASTIGSVLDTLWFNDSREIPIVGSALPLAGEVYTRSEEGISQGLSWGISALPGGIKTLDWNRAGQISPGRVRTALGVTEADLSVVRAERASYDALIASNKPINNYTAEELRLFNKFVAQGASGSNPLYVPLGWDIADPRDERWLFGDTEDDTGLAPLSLDSMGVSENAGRANFISGATDAVKTWYLDPLVLGGKAVKIARMGSDLLGVAGRTVRDTAHPSVQRDIAQSTDEYLRWLDTDGAEGSKTWIGVEAENVAKRRGLELVNEKWLETSPYRDDLIPILDSIKPGEEDVAALLLSAASGASSAHIEELSRRSPAIFDALSNLRRQNSYEWMELNRPLGRPGAVILDDLLEQNVDIQGVVTDLLRRDEALASLNSVLGSSISPITTFGSRSTKLKPIMQEWRAGKTKRAEVRGGRKVAVRNRTAEDGYPQQDPFDEAMAMRDLNQTAIVALMRATPEGELPNPALVQQGMSNAAQDAPAFFDLARAVNPGRELPYGTKSALMQSVFQLSSNFRKIAVWEWVQGQRGAGYLQIRGPGAGRASDEWQASLTDSPTLRADQAFIDQIKLDWMNAPESKRVFVAAALENRAVMRIAEHYGLNKDEIQEARKIYEYVDKARAKAVSQARGKARGNLVGVLPDDGSGLMFGDALRSQLDTSIPIINFKLMDRQIRNLAHASNKDAIHAVGDALALAINPRNAAARNRLSLSTLAEKGTMIADQILAAWKASVLFRLGYTVRNNVEGWLRSLAATGSVQALAPANIARGAKNMVVNPYNARKVNRIDRTMQGVSEVLESTRRMQNRAVLQGDKYVKALRENAALDPQFRKSPQWVGRMNSLLRAAEKDYDNLQAQIDDYEGVIAKLTADRAGRGKKRIGWDESFSGESGEVMAARSSNDVTVQNFFETSSTRDQILGQLGSSWERVSAPTLPESVAKMNAERYAEWLKSNAGQKWQKQNDLYWNALSESAMQMRTDAFGKIALQADTIDDLARYWHTPEGRAYAYEMGFRDKSGFIDEDAIAEYTSKWFSTTHGYFPSKASRELALTEHSTPQQFRAKMSQEEKLTDIHGRLPDESVQVQHLMRDFRSWAFKWLGNKPETALNRHPFYNESWKNNKDKLWKQAIAAGEDVNDPQLIVRINNTAARRALEDTENIMFTIQRYSNPAAMMRFMSPFFAAFENSIRTWTGIIVRDPSVLARAGMLWNLPNAMGMVVDSKGNKVAEDKWSFITGDAGNQQYIVLPDIFRIGGEQVRIPKPSLNVVTPGEAPLLPGGGPLVVYPAGVLLAGRPDLAEYIKSLIGPELFSQFAPFGQTSPDFIDAFAPAWGRKLYTMLAGDNNEDYARVKAAIVKDAVVRAQLDDSPMPTEDAITERANAFWLFSAVSSLGLPFSVSRVSEFQPQVDYWNNLQADGSLSFEEKIGRFHDKWGDSYTPLTTGTLESHITGLTPTQQMFKSMKDYEPMIRDLNDALPNNSGLPASILASTMNSGGGYSPGVANYWLTEIEPGTGNTYKTRRDAVDIATEVKVSQMWDEYLKFASQRDDAMAKRGITSLNSAAARDSGITAMWEQTKDYMTEKYGDAYTAWGPPSFSNRTPTTLATIRRLVSNKEFMASDLGQSSIWQSLKEYMQVREQATEAIARGQEKKSVQAVFDEWVGAWRLSSLGLADFYDTYLDQDTLGTRVGKVE